MPDKCKPSSSRRQPKGVELVNMEATAEKYIVALFEKDYEVEADTRARATALGIKAYRADKDDTETPTAVLRSFSSTRKATVRHCISEKQVRGLYNG